MFVQPYPQPWPLFFSPLYGRCQTSGYQWRAPMLQVNPTPQQQRQAMQRALPPELRRAAADGVVAMGSPLAENPLSASPGSPRRCASCGGNLCCGPGMTTAKCCRLISGARTQGPSQSPLGGRCPACIPACNWPQEYCHCGQCKPCPGKDCGKYERSATPEVTFVEAVEAARSGYESARRGEPLPETILRKLDAYRRRNPDGPCICTGGYYSLSHGFVCTSKKCYETWRDYVQSLPPPPPGAPKQPSVRAPSPAPTPRPGAPTLRAASPNPEGPPSIAGPGRPTQGCTWKWVHIGNKAYYCCIKEGSGSWCDEKPITIPQSAQQPQVPGYLRGGAPRAAALMRRAA